VDALIVSKRAMGVHFHTMVNKLSGRLDLNVEQTIEALSGISALLTGSYDGSSDSVMENEVIPEDVATFMGYFDMKVRFETSAGYILQGIRSSSR
jgi:hypothetical protein